METTGTFCNKYDSQILRVITKLSTYVYQDLHQQEEECIVL
jgi:hypothetical protein